MGGSMVYKWTEEDLFKDLQEVQRLADEEKDESKKKELNNFASLIQENILSEEYFYELDSMPLANSNSNYLSNLQKKVDRYHQCYQYLEEFANILLPKFRLSKYYYRERSNLRLSENDIVELSHEFFKSTNKDFYNLYLKLYKRRNNHIRFVDAPFESNVIFVPGVNKPYVTICKKNDDDYINNLSDLNHEEGHSISALINPSRYFKKKMNFYEIESIFFDFLGNEFLAKELNDDSFRKESYMQLSGFYYLAKELLMEKSLVSKNDSDECDSLDFLLQNESPLNNVFTRILNTDQKMCYAFSSVIAVELCSLYKEDKDLALNILKSIVSDNDKEKEFSNIVSQVTPNKRLAKIIK